MNTENFKAQENEAQELAQKAVEWLNTLKEWDLTAIANSIHEMEYAYLISDMADDKNERSDVIFHQDLLARFLNDLSQFSDGAFSDLSKLLNPEPCIETK